MQITRDQAKAVLAAINTEKQRRVIDADIQRRIESGEMFSRRAYADGPAVDFPVKLEFLFEAHRYKVGYGGRGSTKSWSFARGLLILGAEKPLRIVCARFTKDSLKESVHELLTQQIALMEMQHLYRIQEGKIYGTNGTEILFYGLGDRHIDAIKSFEGADIVWVEEAALIGKSAWRKLSPTVRKPGSEIWITFNPELDTDATYVLFVVKPDKQVRSAKINWQENPWFPEVLRVEMESLRESSYDEYLHIYEGNPKESVEGAIFSNEIKAALTEERITTVPYDRTKPVDIAYDLGFGDPTVLWFVQGYGGFLNFIDFYQSDDEDISHFVMVANQRGYVLRDHWLPWDSAAWQHKKLRGVADKNISIPQIMKALGCNVQQGQGLEKVDSLNLMRGKWPLSRFDREKCAEGLNALRHYQWDRKPLRPDVEGGKKGQRQPLHNWASHAADAYAVACSIPVIETEKPKPVEVPKVAQPLAHRGMMI